MPVGRSFHCWRAAARVLEVADVEGVGTDTAAALLVAWVWRVLGAARYAWMGKAPFIRARVREEQREEKLERRGLCSVL